MIIPSNARRGSSYYLFTTNDRFGDEVKAARIVARKVGKTIRLKGRDAIVKDPNGRGYTHGGDVYGGLNNARRFDVYMS